MARKPAPNQKEIDFRTRGDKLGLLETIDRKALASAAKRYNAMRPEGTPKIVVRSVPLYLRALDSFAGDSHDSFPSVPAIARRMAVCESTVHNARRAAIALKLVVVTTRFVCRCGRTFDVDRDPDEARCPCGIAAKACDHTSNLYRICWSRVLALCHKNLHHPPTKLAPPLVQNLHPKRHGETPIEKIHGGDGVLKSRAGGWPFAIRPDLLRRPELVEALWEHAVGKGWVVDAAAERDNFVALLCYCCRRGNSPGKLFTHRLKRVGAARWEGIAAADEDQARAIRRRSEVGNRNLEDPDTAAARGHADQLRELRALRGEKG